mgnify:CR=1 FL=1
MAKMDAVVPDWLETRISGRSEDFYFFMLFCGQIFGYQ